MRKVSFFALLLCFACITSTASAVELGKISKDIMYQLDKSDKYSPTSGYVVDWETVGNLKYIEYKKKDFADEYSGRVKAGISFAGKKAIEAHTKNKSADWYFVATGSRAGISTYELSASIADGPEDIMIIKSLGMSGVSAETLVCNHNDKSISEYDTIKEARFFRLKSKGYADATMIVSDDYAAQFVTKKIILIPNVSVFSGSCK